MARASYALRLSGAAMMGAALRLVGYTAQGLAARSPEYNLILYLLPLAAILIAAAVLRDISFVPMGIRHIFRRPAEKPA